MEIPNMFPCEREKFDRARARQPLPEVPDQPPAGSLVIVDTFQDTKAGAAHGNVAAFAARQHGFRGPIYGEWIGDGRRSPSHAVMDNLNQPVPDPSWVRSGLNAYARARSREGLDAVRGDLDKLRQHGLHDSAVNVSYAVHPQRVAVQLYKDVRMNLLPGAKRPQFARNVVEAYGIDTDKLLHPSREVSGPERTRLYQALFDEVNRGAQAPEVRTALSHYRQSVRNLQAHGNSVVVSAGNEQQDLAQLRREEGVSPRGTPGSAHNLLAPPEVTMVGATRWYTDGQERIAEYSNRDPGVDLYASGSVGNGLDVNRAEESGTSFAAPRVAAAMAALHGTHPGLSSAQVQTLLRNRLTHQTDGVDVLDFQRSEEYMRRGKF